MPMLNQMLSARNDFGRTFMVAMWLLGALAAVQIIAIGWAVVTFPKKSAATLAASSGNPAVADAAAAAPGALSPLAGGDGSSTAVDLAGGSVAPGNVNQDGPSAVAGTSAPNGVGGSPLGTVLPDLVLPGPSPYPTTDAINNAAGLENPAHTISHPVARRMLALALEYRASGNMQAALRSLRDANTLSPNHPRVLSEIASTYSQMGLGDKAAEYWRSVFVLGTERAGAFYDLADMALKGNRITDDSLPVASVLSLGQIETIERQDLPEGEKVTIRIPVESQPGVIPNAADMAMLVYFYDQVNGEDAAPTTADTAENFVSEPYDWQDGGVEVIEESYFQPKFTDAQKKELGERRYFGYIIELYYRDELQDVVAEPRELMSLKPGQPSSDELPDPATEFDSNSGPGAELFPK
jgi:hypothetical protein